MAQEVLLLKAQYIAQGGNRVRDGKIHTHVRSAVRTALRSLLVVAALVSA